MREWAKRLARLLALGIAIPAAIAAEPLTPPGQPDDIPAGEYRLHTEAYPARERSATPVLVVVLHGDSPRKPPSYHYRFAAAIAEQNADVVAVGLLRPGYPDPAGNVSSGIRGVMNGDNYNERNTRSIAAGIVELRSRWNARKVIVVGHSGGAALTANVLGQHPGAIDAAVLVSCPCDVAKWRSHLFDALPAASPRRLTVKRDTGDTLSPIDVVSGIRGGVPVRLIVGAEDDNTIPALSIDYMAAAKALGKDVQLQTLSGVGHEALFEDAVFETVRRLVKS